MQLGSAFAMRHRTITRPNAVRAMDITYIPMARGLLYLAAVMDRASRRVLSWRVSISMDTRFCVDAELFAHVTPLAHPIPQPLPAAA